MTIFDELIDAEPAGAERERLRNVHELLLEAGPPPELTPELSSGPTLDMTLGRVRRMTSSRRRMLNPPLAAALIALIIGINVTGSGQEIVAIPLQGTVAAPHAKGALNVLPAEAHTQPMVVDVQGLDRGLYAVYLVHKGRAWEKCGTFTVTNPAGQRPTTINSPYLAKGGDQWVVTRLTASGRGVIVMRPLPA